MDLLKKILPLSGIFIFIFILWKGIDLKSVRDVLEHINLKYLFPALFFTLLIVFFKAVRLYLLLNENKIRIQFINFLEIFSNTNLLSLVSNLLLSETTGAIAVMHNQSSKTRIANIYFLCNFTDFLVILLLCGLSLIFNYNVIFNFISLKNIVGYKMLLFLLIFLVFFSGLFVLFRKNISSLIKKVLTDVRELVVNSRNTLCSYTLFIYSAYVLAFYFDARTFNINIEFFFLLFVYTLGSLISVIPISINGLGTREAVFIFFMHIKGISNENSFALSLFAFLFAPLLVLLGFYFFVLIKKRILPSFF